MKLVFVMVQNGFKQLNLNILSGFNFPLTNGPMWSSSYGSWIYYYLCNQYLLPCTNVVSSNPFQTRCTWYNIRHLQRYFCYIVAVCFIGGGNWSTRRKPPTCQCVSRHWQTLSHNVVSRTPRHERGSNQWEALITQ